MVEDSFAERIEGVILQNRQQIMKGQANVQSQSDIYINSSPSNKLIRYGDYYNTMSSQGNNSLSVIQRQSRSRSRSRSTHKQSRITKSSKGQKSMKSKTTKTSKKHIRMPSGNTNSISMSQTLKQSDIYEKISTSEDEDTDTDSENENSK